MIQIVRHGYIMQAILDWSGSGIHLDTEEMYKKWMSIAISIGVSNMDVGEKHIEVFIQNLLDSRQKSKVESLV